uniref:Rab9 effector protein with kelch motifs n=1 Tax=Sphenodon punctatus TaxID=8508 RepID=A0A8D0G4Z0_SPHPU
MSPLAVLEPGAAPQRAAWYTLAPLGDSPSARVGHNCLFLPSVPRGGKGRVVVVGGANPNSSFSDAYVIDLETGTWESPEVTGMRPSPRTFHTSSAAIGDKLYVFGGGDKGAEPVKDQQIHVFDAATLTWSQPEVTGDPPAPRHGHVVVAVGTKLFIHGGLAGDKFYDDLFCIDTVAMTWEKLLVTGAVPGGRAAHSAAAFGDHLYLFGGMDPTGALDTMYRYHIENQHWMQIKFDSPLPPGRLDHSMCLIPWPAPAEAEHEDSQAAGRDSEEEKQKEKSSPEEKPLHLCLIFGGMDTQGEIFRDCVVSLIE